MGTIKFYTSEDQMYFEMEEEKVNKEQKIQELTARIEHSQAEIDKIKKELEELQDKPYEISYPKNGEQIYYLSHFTGRVQDWIFDIDDEDDKHLYDTGLYFDTKEEAEQFEREQTLIKKIKCWAKEQQGDWKPDWSDVYEIKYFISFENNRLSIWRWYTNNLLTKLPCFKSQEIVQACIDEFGDEILEVFF